MPDKINITHTFEAIRQLPLDVSFQQVKRWVQQQQNLSKPIPPRPLSFWQQWLRRWFN